MTRQDIIRLAREAGLSLKSFAEPPKPYIYVAGYDDTLERFATLVAAAAKAEEREACASLCERLPAQHRIDVRDECAAVIRARGEK